MTVMRRALILALLFAPLAAIPLAAQAGAPKFAYVNSQEILARAPGRAAAEKAFNDEREGVLKIVQRMQDSLQTMVGAFQREEPKLDSATKESRAKTIRSKQEEYQRRTQQYEQQIGEKQRAFVQPMMEQIRKVLEELRVEGGYTFIFDVGAEGGSIVAADKNLDITDRVITRLKPISATAAARPDTSKAPGPRPAPSGLSRPPAKPPTQ